MIGVGDVVVCRGPYKKKLYPDALVEAVSKHYASGKTQREVATIVGVSFRVVQNVMARHSIKRRRAIPRDQRGANNSAWKGDAVGYNAAHARVYKAIGKPSSCSVCGTTDAKVFDYANLTGRYHDVADYAPMCRSCHTRYDNTARNFGRTTPADPAFIEQIRKLTPHRQGADA